MAHEFTLTRTVEFADTDMAGIMHFSNYFRFMEAAEHAFFRSLGRQVHRGDGGAMRGWARVQVECRYAEPLVFEDVVDVHLMVRLKKPKVLGYAFEFRKRTGDGSRAVAHGTVTTVYVERRGDEPMRSVAMPDEVAGRIEVAPEDVLKEHGYA